MGTHKHKKSLRDLITAYRKEERKEGRKEGREERRERKKEKKGENRKMKSEAYKGLSKQMTFMSQQQLPKLDGNTRPSKC